MLDARGLSCPEPVVMIRKAMMTKAAEYTMVVVGIIVVTIIACVNTFGKKD